MLDKTMERAINRQIKAEFYSAYLYLAMAAHADAANLPGFAHWMRVQTQEEIEHGMKFYKYVNERGGRVVLEAIDRPPEEFESPLDLFEKTLEHEQHVTALIHELYALAVEQKDYASQVMLQWFIGEQVEEESNATAIVETLKLAGDSGNALIMLDRALGSRGG
ncbi:MAG TPA: ferritin [Anaerolineae bacterium]|nr:ferritin [Anaerolineae bacterium]